MPPDNELNKKKLSISSEKILGYLLLVVGILIIAVATVMVLRVLGGKTNPPKVFDVEAPTIQLPQAGSGLSLPEGLTLPEGVDLSQLQSTQQPSGVKIIPDEVFSRLLNSSMVYLAMMFLATSGAKVASIGVQLIKDIKVNVKEKSTPPSQ